ncbi:hypothetical protein [Nocardioides daphniae]|uniref:Uncharacterized protein n=1 Tax=Nocardioides daphniae TaxID=402297 RepID=A0A4P7UAH6_9ACTN|nr:hypothetical protein [Nocardioides daphniae]QCC76248.1 hypothetical protein E2C04_01750 [Nocardioides daphniae]GGD08657.1 hypothetical protein GCM10007231_04360 [Nocardioides daphniae]
MATAFLASYDYAAIDTDEAIAAVPSTEPPRLTGDDLEISAVGRIVWSDLDAHMDAAGVPTELVVSSQGWRCDE